MRPVPFFEADYFSHDLRQGTVFNRSGTRQCFMPSEMIAALVGVMQDEVGPAWREVVARVGRLWGRRVARRYQRELVDFYNRPLHEMPMRELVSLLEGFFRYQGWGLLTLDFSLAERGLIQARLENSAFVEIVGVSDGPVDHIVCGLLAEFFNQVSERTDLECVETECCSAGAPACRMVVAITPRINVVRDQLALGLPHETLVNEILTSTVSN
ncbi:hypothetical protein GC173_14890 [bacterium]|nr:hypothetical protein [bacterium]